MATILVVGQERCGTHTLFNMLRDSGVEVNHEAYPTLCFEAYSRVVKGFFRLENLKIKISNIKNKAEVNHRLQFFVDILAKELPETKFIFLVRDPVKVIVSKIGTLAHWPTRTELPNWYIERANKYVPSGKEEFNLYRIPPQSNREPLAIKHLQSWLRGLMVSLPLLEKLEDQLWLIKTGKICADGVALWKWLGLDWTEEVKKSACYKSDSVYDLFGNDNLVEWAQEQVNPHINRIHEEFNNTLIKYPLGRKILHMIYHK